MHHFIYRIIGILQPHIKYAKQNYGVNNAWFIPGTNIVPGNTIYGMIIGQI